METLRTLDQGSQGARRRGDIRRSLGSMTEVHHAIGKGEAVIRLSGLLRSIIKNRSVYLDVAVREANQP
ncbi:hypothetical protein [Streptomyces sp. NRRL B-24085]|uniref:hypothetical protein n=1 Tax=Streptomyces sp. NRRL B-24085 TaxID=1709476 RepID=UPI0006B326D8|nr:hypothetical protein [Streptomyces sp. NRRL B-24085]